MEIFWGLLGMGVLLALVISQGLKRVAIALFAIQAIGEQSMPKLDSLNAALDSIDTATTELADQLTRLADRVDDDDITPEELSAAVAKAAALATRISDASTAVAGIEPTPVVVPDPVEDPNEEPDDEPIEPPPAEVPGDATPPGAEGTDPVDGTTPVDQPGTGSTEPPVIPGPAEPDVDLDGDDLPPTIPFS